MQIQFVIGSEIRFSAKLDITREQLFKESVIENIPKQTFKIPIQKNQFNLPSTFTKQKRVIELDYDDEDESSISDDSFDANEELEEEEDAIKSLKSSEDFSDSLSNKKHLRRYRNDIDVNYHLHDYDRTNEKKSKREMTEDEIMKKNDQTLKRKLQAKKVVEEEKRQTIEKILNEDGKKLKERQKKINEEAARREQLAEENYKVSLTKIKLKHERDGRISLRFPQGLLLPKVLMQKSSANKLPSSPLKCQVMNCQNEKKYKDPNTKMNYCSVGCYKLLKSLMHIS